MLLRQMVFVTVGILLCDVSHQPGGADRPHHLGPNLAAEVLSFSLMQPMGWVQGTVLAEGQLALKPFELLPL